MFVVPGPSEWYFSTNIFTWVRFNFIFIVVYFFTFVTIWVIVDDVLKAHDNDGYLIAVSDGSVKHTHQMGFGWVLFTAGGLDLAKSYGGYDGRGSSLQAEVIGMLSISFFIALIGKHRKRTNIKIIYVSDNLELINRSKEHLNYISPYTQITRCQLNSTSLNKST